MLNLTLQLDQTVQQLSRQPQQPTPPPVQPKPQGFEFGDDDYIQGRQMRQIIEQYGNRRDPLAERALAAAAENAMGFAQLKPENKEVFERYGPEIRALVAQMAPEARTLDNLQVAVDLVQGRHWRDLVASEAQRFAAENPTMRSTGGAGSGSHIPNNIDRGVLENPDIPEEQRTRLKAMGITEQQIRDFCQTNNMVAADFVKLYAPIKGERAIQTDPFTPTRTV